MTDRTAHNSPPADRARLLGCQIDRLDLDETVAACDEIIRHRDPVQQVSVNALKVVMMRRDPALKAAFASAGLVSADGVPIVWASRIVGDPLPGRVNGTDLMYRLFELAERRQYRTYILGATTEVLGRATRELAVLYPNLTLTGSHHGYFTDTDDEDVCRKIRAADPDILFLAMGSPKKEVWVAEHFDELRVPLVIGVGGSVDVLAGITRRAPRWMQRNGLEWAFRLAQEPKRLTRRYTVTNAQFVALVLMEMAQRRFRSLF